MPDKKDFRLAEHLPNLRPDGKPPSPEELPRQRNGVTPQMHGRYPDYNVLDEVDHWDEATRRVVLERVQNVPEIRFFTREEAVTLGTFLDLLLAQDHEPKIPVLNMVDAKLFAGELDGFRYADMPDDRETWRRVAAGLDAAAVQHGSIEFAGASHEIQERVVDAFAKGALHGRVWDELPPSIAWKVVTRGALGAFYSHPWAWNEIGFGGPAYPRGYARMGVGQRESWEGAEAFEADPVNVTERRADQEPARP
ncbi:MAG TPA: gluconate 2-dehydrogenase subunit 3 family protein [Solirubrobacteraceae bacterium]|nr:gluconate 2-dehydrogenase subunit 3 family protein [Solirubrobacteraceae bacterium]